MTQAARLRDLLGELAERVSVRVLLWAGAPLPLFKPARSAVRGVRDELTRGTRVECALDAKERPLHCHHEKIVIIDGEIAFVGGIDLTALGGDRFDSSEHPMRGRIGWHDVATRLRGPAVADVAAHFAARWSEVTGQPLEPPSPPARPARTSSRSCARSPRRSTTSLRTAPSGSSRPTRERCARRARWSISKASSCGRRSSSRSSPTSCATRPATTSAWSCCCPPGPTTARTRRAGSSACSPRPTGAAGASSPRRSRRAAAGSPGRSTSTPRSGSSTTRG